ncbi:MAG: pimeloyl-ACP methyl ester carboxylesterase [Planctomycetota bacterium]|jgi:pimeloyl-ACP methyl ester carboxylesterase
MSVPHRLLQTYRLPDLLVREHLFEVPLNHGLDPASSIPVSERIEVFAREVVAPERAQDDLPWLIFLQGGPGFGAPRPMDNSGWIKRALKDHRVLLMDERGTGRSTPQTFQSLGHLEDPKAQAEQLAMFRADSIVADCELLRRELLGEDKPWKVLGQSFGGFCATNYLSAAPNGLSAALLTGGLPPLDATAEEIYRRTYPLVIERNHNYYERYPEDVELIRAVAERLDRGDVQLPTGGLLSTQFLQVVGLSLGMSDGAEAIHYLFEDAWVAGQVGEELSYQFLRKFENHQSFDTNPIFALLHEGCYTQGSASRWSADRVRAEFPGFDSPDGPLQFTGEMIYPWMFDELPALQPLAAAAEHLAQRKDWPRLYDPKVLAQNTVPVAAAVYHNDMFVEREFSLETAKAIRGTKTWITNEYEHNGLRVDGEHILDRLLEMTV